MAGRTDGIRLSLTMSKRPTPYITSTLPVVHQERPVDTISIIEFKTRGAQCSRVQQAYDQVVALLESACGALDHSHEARSSIARASSLLKEAVSPAPTRGRPGTRAPGLLAWQARRVREYIDAHLGQPLRVADLSRLVSKTEAHFSRVFRASFGLPPHAYLIQRRVELAASLIRTGDGSLTDIALKCGFTDQAHLCKRFRQLMGTTPSAWRRANSVAFDEPPEAPIAGPERLTLVARSGVRPGSGAMAQLT
jgi:AraC family transcriptional regulator